MTLFSESILFDLLLIIGICLLAVHTLIAYARSKWTRRGIPYSNIDLIFGNIKDVVFGRQTFLDAIRNFYMEHRNKPFISFFSFMQPMVMINDMELVKCVLVKDFSSFTDRNFNASPSDPMEYHNMFTMKGHAWRNLRLKLAPTFTSGKMKKMFEYVDSCGKELVNCMEKEVGDISEVEVKELFARYTTDIIATCAFGINGNALKNTESVFRYYMRKSVDPDFWQLIVASLMFLSPSLVEKFNLSVTKPDVADFFRKTVWDTVRYRERNKISRNDFLGLMMQLRKVGSLKDDDPMEEEEEVLEQSTEHVDLEGDKFVAQCFLFLVAGFETSSATISYALYEMALNPEVQKKVCEEITTVLAKHGGRISYDAIQEMEYLHMVIQETLRKYPVLLFLDRQVTRPYRLPGTGIELKRGEAVMIPVIGLHYDPELYPEPQRFDPERFSEEQRRSRPACSFLGFGDGPRICIGMRMAWMQTKVGLICTLLNYEASPSARTQIPLTFKSSIFTQVKGGIHLLLKKRSALVD